MSQETRPIGKVFPNTENYTHKSYNYRPVEKWSGIIELEGAVIVDRGELYDLVMDMCCEQSDYWGVGYKVASMNTKIVLDMAPWDTVPINQIEKAARYFVCFRYKQAYDN